MSAPTMASGCVKRISKCFQLWHVQRWSSSYSAIQSSRLLHTGQVGLMSSNDGSKKQILPQLNLARPGKRQKQTKQQPVQDTMDSNEDKTSKAQMSSSKSGKKQKWKQKKQEQKLDTSSSDDDGVDSNLVSAAKVVAKSLKGDVETIQSELLQQLKGHVQLTEAQKQGQMPPTNVSDLVAGLKIDQRKDRDSDAMDHGLKFAKRRQSRQGDDRYIEADNVKHIKLFTGPRLGIFAPVADAQEPSSVADSPPESLFDRIQREEKERSMSLPPANAFEEMIHWTKQGKLWNFPINNEQGLEDEAKVGFHEHVFIEQYLNDFPQKGPVRLFMELVTVGLSKNPYITVQQKKEHIEWFRNYFSDKLEIIEELTVTASKEEQKEQQN